MLQNELHRIRIIQVTELGYTTFDNNNREDFCLLALLCFIPKIDERCAHHANFCGYKVAQSVEPFNVSLQVARFPFAEETLRDKSSTVIEIVKLLLYPCPFFFHLQSYVIFDYSCVTSFTLWLSEGLF